MKLHRLLALSVLLPALSSATPAHAQCNGYSPPRPPVGGNYGGPSDTLPGGGGPTTPSPRGPSAPGPSSGGPSTPGPGGPCAPAPGRPAGPSTSPGTSTPDLSDWSWWWSYNRDPYLQIKRSVLGDAVLTGTDDYFLGKGQKQTSSSRLPDSDAIQSSIGPALQEIVDSGKQAMQHDAMLAIAKLHPLFVPEGKSLVELISQHLSASNQKLAETALVALGLTGDIRCIQILADIAADNAAGRKLLGRESVPARTRPLAALAMGVLGNQLGNEDAQRLLVGRLGEILNQAEGASPDLHVACITTIGLTPLPEIGPSTDSKLKPRLSPTSGREAQVRFLMAILRDDKRHEMARAHAPKALALLATDASKLLRDQVKFELLQDLKRLKRKDRLVRYGIVEALGMLGDADDEKIDSDLRDALHTSVRDGDNSQRGLSLIALGLASSRAGESREPFAALPGERKYLLKQLANGKSRLRTWSALALGLQTYHSVKAGEPQSNDVFEALLNSYEKTSSPADAGAYSIAMGLFGDQRAEPEMLERLERSADDDARGFAAIGLGLLRADSAVAALEALVTESRFHPVALRKASVSLAMLGQKGIVPGLLKSVDESKSAALKSASIAALALVGDYRVVDPLVAFLEDSDELDSSRGFAAAALGIICEQEPLPWTAQFSNHLNYFAMTETLVAPDASGILNLR